jgi:hypothetical protein
MSFLPNIPVKNSVLVLQVGCCSVGFVTHQHINVITHNFQRNSWIDTNKTTTAMDHQSGIFYLNDRIQQNRNNWHEHILGMDPRRNTQQILQYKP